MTMSIGIIEDVMDEMRRERKVRMVLADEDLEEYIELDLNNMPPEDEQTEFEKGVVRKKLTFRKEIVQNMAVLKLAYMFAMIKKIYPETASMLNAEAFKIKMIKMENKR